MTQPTRPINSEKGGSPPWDPSLSATALRLSGIAKESIVDGPGIRCALFVQGCPHRCPGCHNPHTHSFDGGYEQDVDQVLTSILANPLISGVTFSGGEPLCQAEALGILAYRLKKAGLTIALFSGYTLEEILLENDSHRVSLLRLCDILIDGRYEESKRDLSLRFRGSSNQRILNLKSSLQQGLAVPENNPIWGGRQTG